MRAVCDAIESLAPCLEGICSGPLFEGSFATSIRNTDDPPQDASETGCEISKPPQSQQALEYFHEHPELGRRWAELAAVNATHINSWAGAYCNISWEIEVMESEAANVAPWASWAEDVMYGLLEVRPDECRKLSEPVAVQRIQKSWKSKPLVAATNLNDYDEVPETTPAPSPSSILAAQLAKPGPVGILVGPLSPSRTAPRILPKAMQRQKAKQEEEALAAQVHTRCKDTAVNDKKDQHCREMAIQASAERAVDSFFHDITAAYKQEQEEAAAKAAAAAPTISPAAANAESEADEFEFIVAVPTSPVTPFPLTPSVGSWCSPRLLLPPAAVKTASEATEAAEEEDDMGKTTPVEEEPPASPMALTPSVASWYVPRPEFPLLQKAAAAKSKVAESKEVVEEEKQEEKTEEKTAEEPVPTPPASPLALTPSVGSWCSAKPDFALIQKAEAAKAEAEAEKKECKLASSSSSSPRAASASPTSDKAQYFYFMDEDDDDEEEEEEACEAENSHESADSSEPVPEPMPLKELIAQRSAEILGEVGAGAAPSKKCSSSSGEGRDRADTASTEASLSDDADLAGGAFVLLEEEDQIEDKATNSMPPAETVATFEEEPEEGGDADNNADDWTVVREDDQPTDWTVLTEEMIA